MEHQKHEKCRNELHKKNLLAICGLRAVIVFLGFPHIIYSKISTPFFSLPCKADIHRKTHMHWRPFVLCTTIYFFFNTQQLGFFWC
jgi:hypothetical protein